MRFTVKAKLASAFGVVLLLSMAAGGLAYVKLSEMIDTADSLVSRAGRMERAAEIERGILLQVRAEKNLLLAPESESERFLAEIAKQRVRIGELPPDQQRFQHHHTARDERATRIQRLCARRHG